MKQKPDLGRPSLEVIEKALQKQKRIVLIRKAVWDTLRAILICAAAIIVLSYLWLPVFQVSGSNMDPALTNGDTIVAAREKAFHRGDIVVFHYDSKVLVKRVIALGGDTVSISSDGTVSVNGAVLDEPYVSSKSLGQCDIQFPYTVPANHLFVLGDDRASSLDSRVGMIVPVGMEQVVGKAVFRLLPLGRLGPIH